MFTTTAAGPGPAPTPPGAAVIGGLELNPKAFRAEVTGPSAEPARPRGTRVTFTLSKAASVTFDVGRSAPGRRSGGRCVRPTARNSGRRRCRRQVKVGSFKVAGKAGPNAFRFTGRVDGRSLRPGRHRLTATPIAGGTQGNIVAAPFRITRR
jgi:hypothetical protein